MFSTCLFCYRDLGKNEFVENFQVGRRLAFDAAKGRLWVVCRSCERWNLTPLEERWEAIEECEKAYSDTRRRVSTDNIGFARVREGLELVRIGKPKLPEMAAWRYGDQFGRRRRRHILLYGAPSAVATALYFGQFVLGGAIGLPMLGIQAWLFSARALRRKRAATLLRCGEELIPVAGKEMEEFRIIPTQDHDGWSLIAPRRVRLIRSGQPAAARLVTSPAADATARLTGWSERAVEYRGTDAVAALRKVLPFLNWAGGSAQTVEHAAAHIEGTPTVERYFASVASRARKHSNEPWSERRGETRLGSLTPSMLLGLEMAAHEETERRAMEGELARLEDEWRDAEEIASIADNMFLPDEITSWVERRKSGADPNA